MKSIRRFNRWLIASGITVALVVAALAGTQLGSKPVAAQVTPPFDVFVFHCALIPNQTLESSNLGSFNLTFTGATGAFIQPSDCAKVMADALNAGYRLKAELALPNGGPNGTGATEYVFVKGGTN